MSDRSGRPVRLLLNVLTFVEPPSDRSARPVGKKQRIHGKNSALKMLPDRCRRVRWNPLRITRPVGPTGSADRFSQCLFFSFWPDWSAFSSTAPTAFPTGSSDRSVLVLNALLLDFFQVCSNYFFFYSFVLLQSNICSSSSTASKPQALQCNASLGNCIIFPFA